MHMGDHHFDYGCRFAMASVGDTGLGLLLIHNIDGEFSLNT